MRYLFAGFFFLFIHQGVKAQEIIEIEGLVFRADTKEPLRFANVSSVKYRRGYPTDENGRFRFKIEFGDTLMISYLGYFERKYAINESIMDVRRGLVVELEPRIYELSQVTIRNLRELPGFNRAEEKQEILIIPGVKVGNTGPTNPLNYYKPSVGFGGNAGFGVTLQGGITALLSNFDNYYKQLKKLQMLEAKERQEKAVEKLYRERYNEELIGPIVNLKGAELRDFMERYKPHPVFLAAATDYELTEYLFEKLRNYNRITRGQR